MNKRERKAHPEGGGFQSASSAEPPKQSKKTSNASPSTRDKHATPNVGDKVYYVMDGNIGVIETINDRQITIRVTTGDNCGALVLDRQANPDPFENWEYWEPVEVDMRSDDPYVFPINGVPQNSSAHRPRPYFLEAQAEYWNRHRYGNLHEDYCDNDSKTKYLLHYAVEARDEPSVRVFLQEGHSWIPEECATGWRRLELNSEERDGRIERAHLLLENTLNHNGSTPLQIYVENDPAMIHTLLEYSRDDINGTENDRPIFALVWNGEVDAVAALLEYDELDLTLTSNQNNDQTQWDIFVMADHLNQLKQDKLTRELNKEKAAGKKPGKYPEWWKKWPCFEKEAEGRERMFKLLTEYRNTHSAEIEQAIEKKRREKEEKQRTDTVLVANVKASNEKILEEKEITFDCPICTLALYEIEMDNDVLIKRNLVKCVDGCGTTHRGCGAVFHKECIKGWRVMCTMGPDIPCPMCRATPMHATPYEPTEHTKDKKFEGYYLTNKTTLRF